MLSTRKASTLLTVSICALVGIVANPARSTDPGAMGPFAVTSIEYGDYNDEDWEFSPYGFEVKASVYYPTDLTHGPYPLVVFVHGVHATCYRGSEVRIVWPCNVEEGWEPIPNHEGYAYAAELLASHGYIVVSISANALAFHREAISDLEYDPSSELLQHHLNLWNTFNVDGGDPFGDLFVGKVDMDNVGTMGHSRSGEVVAAHYRYNREQEEPDSYGIRAVMPLAAVNNKRYVVDNVPLGVVLSYCDGDCATEQGIRYYDDARYSAVDDATPKHVFLVLGGNHAFYNTVWTPGFFPGGFDDNPFVFDSECGIDSPHRLSASEQRAVAKAYIAAFFRTYLGGETGFQDILTGEAVPPGVDRMRVSFHAAAENRLDLNRLDGEGSLTTNTLGGTAAGSGNLAYYSMCGTEAEPGCALQFTPWDQPHTLPWPVQDPLPGLTQLKLGWNVPGATYENVLPPGNRDLTGFYDLEFRTVVNFMPVFEPVPPGGLSPEGVDQDFTVALVDGGGASASVQVSDFSEALRYPPGTFGNGTDSSTRMMLSTVHIPLDRFAGVDLTDVTTVRFAFDETESGLISLSDIGFSKHYGDRDGDGVIDLLDNCTDVANADQYDADDDGFGNVCDGDFDANGAVDGADYGAFVVVFGTSVPPTDGKFDVTPNGAIDGGDYAAFVAMFGGKPGSACGNEPGVGCPHQPGMSP